MARPSDKKKDDKNKRSSRNNLFKRRKFCRFTVEKIAEVDYKDINILQGIRFRKRQTDPGTYHRHQNTLSAPIEHRRKTRALLGLDALH